MPEKKKDKEDTTPMDEETEVSLETKPEAPSLQILYGSEIKNRKMKKIHGSDEN